jgi:uncharacterized Ntn-hydrolase superfamily protein
VKGGDKRWGSLQSAAIKIADPNNPGRGNDHIALAIEVGENINPVAEMKRIYYTTGRRLGYRSFSKVEGNDVVELKQMLHALGYWRPGLATFPDPPANGNTPELQEQRRNYTRDFATFDDETIAAVDKYRTDNKLNYQGNAAGLVDDRLVDSLKAAYLAKRKGGK